RVWESTPRQPCDGEGWRRRALPLERPLRREWAAWGDIDVHAHQLRVHRYLATCLHSRNLHALWCRSRASARRVTRGAPSGHARSPLRFTPTPGSLLRACIVTVRNGG